MKQIDFIIKAQERSGIDWMLIPHSSSMVDGFILADQARDGDWIDKPARYRRSGEFLEVVKQEWSSSDHFDHEGEFYKVKDAWSSVRPEGGRVPIYFGGASADAVRVGAEHADVFAIGETEDEAWAKGREIPPGTPPPWWSAAMSRSPTR